MAQFLEDQRQLGIALHDQNGDRPVFIMHGRRIERNFCLLANRNPVIILLEYDQPAVRFKNRLVRVINNDPILAVDNTDCSLCVQIPVDLANTPPAHPAEQLRIFRLISHDIKLMPREIENLREYF